MGNFRSKYRYSWRTSSSNPEKSAFGGIAPSSTLLNGLISYWGLGEASGNRANSIAGENDAVPVNAPTATPGLVGNAAQLNTTSPARYFTVAAAGSSIPTTGTRTWAFAVKWDNLSTQPGLFGANNGTDWYVLLLGASNFVRFRLTTGGVNSLDSQAVITATGVWYIIRIWYDSDASEIGIQVDGNAKKTLAVTGTPAWSSTGWNLGSFGSFAHDGVMDEVGVWNRVLTDAEWTALRAAWGGGTGYPF